MGLPAEDFTMNIHLQGLYGGKHIDGIKRFASNFQYLSDYAQKTLSVENEDKPNGYDIRHTLELAQRIPIRCTLDTHHYACHRMVETEKIKLEEKTVNRKVRDVDHISHTDDYFIEAVKSWRGVRPLFHKSQSFHPENPDYWMKPNAHSETYWDEELMARHVPMLEYADFDIETPSEEDVRIQLTNQINNLSIQNKLIFTSTFSSHIVRLKTLINAGKSLNRKVVLLGSSLNLHSKIARKLKKLEFF